MGGTIRLFKFSGITVYLHFSWFLITAFEFSRRTGVYTSMVWAAFEYLALFAIVLLHEFGHALACRQPAGSPIASSSGRWAASRSSIRHGARARCSGVSQPVH